MNDMTIIDYDTNAAIDPDLINGQAKYESTCALCHRLDAMTLVFDEVEVIGDLADDDPVEFVHKVRFGQPGTTMPSSFDVGWTTNDVRDILGHSQTLPHFCG